MNKTWKILIAAITGASACAIWLLPLGYAFQIVLLGLTAMTIIRLLEEHGATK